MTATEPDNLVKQHCGATPNSSINLREMQFLRMPSLIPYGQAPQLEEKGRRSWDPEGMGPWRHPRSM